MNALKKLSFCTLLSLGLFAQTAHAESFLDITDYPSWLKVNFLSMITTSTNTLVQPVS